MEHHQYATAQDSGKHSIIDDSSQPGLEVNSGSHATSPSGWQSESKQVWNQSTTDYAPTALHTDWPGRRILGLSVGTFWAIVVLVAVLLAGGIGGGVGAGLASRKTACPTSATTPATGVPAGTQSTTSTSPISPSTAGSTPASTAAQSSTTTSAASATVSPAPTTDCQTKTNFNGTSIVPLGADGNVISFGTTKQQTFTVYCNTNWPGGAAYGNPGLHDIMKMYQPDLTHCVAACAEYNAAYASNTAAGIDVGGGYCRAVALVLAPGEFCYLKNGTGLNDTSTSNGNRIDSAMLN